jgi:hypothetical protein
LLRLPSKGGTQHILCFLILRIPFYFSHHFIPPLLSLSSLFFFSLSSSLKKRNDYYNYYSCSDCWFEKESGRYYRCRVSLSLSLTLSLSHSLTRSFRCSLSLNNVLLNSPQHHTTKLHFFHFLCFSSFCWFVWGYKTNEWWNMIQMTIEPLREQHNTSD